MTAPSDNLNDLEGDSANLSTLINTIVNLAIDGAPIQEVNNLLWIARDLAERLTVTASACHHKVMNERKAAGGAGVAMKTNHFLPDEIAGGSIGEVTDKAPRPWRLNREDDFSSLVDANGEPIFQVDDEGGILADPDVWKFIIETVNGDEGQHH